MILLGILAMALLAVPLVSLACMALAMAEGDGM